MPNITVKKDICKMLLWASLGEIFKASSDLVCRGDMYARLANLANDVSGKKTTDEVKERLKSFYTEIKESSDRLLVTSLMKNRIGDLLGNFYSKLCEKSDIKDRIRFGGRQH